MRRGRRKEKRIKLLALDMDGTLLDGQSKVLPSSVDALHAALAAGVKVCLATGKARPAALRAMESVGLAGIIMFILPSVKSVYSKCQSVHHQS